MKTSIFFIVFLSLSLSLHAQQEDIMKLYNQAQQATDMGNWDDAIALYGKVLKMNPQFANAYLGLGNVYIKKGQDVNSLENAIQNFSDYLRLKPNATNATDVKTSLDKLQYILDKAYQKRDNRELLQGRWASTDGKYDKYNRSLFIFDIKEFDNKLQISIDPSSLVYSKDFFTKTVYVDDPNANEYAISFTNDKNYIPSQAKYDSNSKLINDVTSQLGSSGGILNDIFQGLNSSAQEKDLQKETLTGFDLKITSTPDENKELKCAIHVYIKEKTPVNEQIVLDTVFVDGLHKVSNDFQNTSPIIGVNGNFNAVTGNTNPYIGTTRINRSINLSDYPDKKIANLYKSGKSQSMIGAVFAGVGLGSVLVGAVWPMLNGNNDSSGKSVGKYLLLGGGVATVIGVPLVITGSHATNKAIRLYNESLETKKNVSELKVGFTGNGVGLALAF